MGLVTQAGAATLPNFQYMDAATLRWIRRHKPISQSGTDSIGTDFDITYPLPSSWFERQELIDALLFQAVVWLVLMRTE